ncbi:MAG: GNAT family protein [Planctomycetota bacterium]|nr:GNAT family protein [Planctomycetota bacterium]
MPRSTRPARDAAPTRPAPKGPAPAVRGLARAACVGELTFLRLPTGADRDEWVKLREISERHLLPWDPTPPGMDEPPPADILFGKLLSTCDTEHSRRYLICAKDSGGIVGQVSLNQVFRGPFQNAVAGYWIGAPFTRRGYMADALRTVLAHAFQDLRLHRVEANIIPQNVASIALVRAAGFRLEGLSLRYLRINGAWRDHERWAMTIEDWNALSAPGTARAPRRAPTSGAPRGGSSARRGTRPPDGR